MSGESSKAAQGRGIAATVATNTSGTPAYELPWFVKLLYPLMVNCS